MPCLPLWDLPYPGIDPMSPGSPAWQMDSLPLSHQGCYVQDIMNAVLCLVAQFCQTLCDPMGCSSPGSSVHGDSPGKNTGVGCHALLQEIFPTQGLNPGLPHCRWVLYQMSHQRSPIPLDCQSTGLNSLCHTANSQWLFYIC